MEGHGGSLRVETGCWPRCNSDTFNSLLCILVVVVIFCFYLTLPTLVLHVDKVICANWDEAAQGGNKQTILSLRKSTYWAAGDR